MKKQNLRKKKRPKKKNVCLFDNDKDVILGSGQQQVTLWQGLPKVIVVYCAHCKATMYKSTIYRWYKYIASHIV